MGCEGRPTQLGWAKRVPGASARPAGCDDVAICGRPVSNHAHFVCIGVTVGDIFTTLRSIWDGGDISGGSVVVDRLISNGVLRVASVVAVLGALIVPGTPAAAAIEQLVPVDGIEFSETSAAAPLTPGIASQTHFSDGSIEYLAAGGGFASARASGDEYTVKDVTLDGESTSSTVEIDPAGYDAVSDLQVEDEFLWMQNTLYAGGVCCIAGASVPFRINRESGAVIAAPESPDTAGSARMSTDGRFVTGNFGDPYWMELKLGVPENFAAADFAADELVPTMAPDGTYVAITGNRTAGAEVIDQLWVQATLPEVAGGEREQKLIELPCPVEDCEYEVGAINVMGTETSIFVSGYSLDGADRSAANHYQVFLADGRVEPSIPVSIASPNGQYVVGMAGDDVELSSSSFVVRDLASGRERTFTSNFDAGYIVKPIGISDDGRTMRYSSKVPCDGVCVISDAFFGSIVLEAVADLTRGPAEDEILRLYRAAFGRIPDPGGFAFWIERYRDGESLFDIGQGFSLSPEFVERFGAEPTDAVLVDGLYRNVLGRAGDAGGFEFWVGERGRGVTIASLLLSFANSDENVERTDTRPSIGISEGRVLRLYRAMLGRDPDAGGLEFWTGRYDAGLSLLDMAVQFAALAEYSALYGADPTDVELVDAVYLNVLDREGDNRGVRFWLDSLEDGLTAAELFAAFADSPENIENTGTVR